MKKNGKETQYDGNDEDLEGEQSDEFQGNQDDNIYSEEYHLNCNIMRVGYSFCPEDRNKYSQHST